MHLGGALGPRRTTFIGRTDERAAATAAMDRHRLVTLVGPGGAGKTSLALEIARDLGGAALAELAAVPAGGVAAAVARAAGLAEHEDVGSLAATLAPAHGLLVVDDAEGLAAEVATVVDAVLAAAPDVRVLATSRCPLGVIGERVVPLGPMAPDEAVQLLTERAALGGVALTDGAATRRLCDHLDRLPLALELAAHQLRHHGVAELDDALVDRFRILRRKPAAGANNDDRADADRHASLWATIETSAARLSDGARTLLAVASVFRGPFDRADLVAVAGDADALPDLVDASLVAADTAGPAARFSLLESVRHFAAEHLAISPHSADVAANFVAWALSTASTPAAPDHLASLTVALDAADAAERLELTLLLTELWERRAEFTEGRHRLADAAGALPPNDAGHARVQLALGRLALRQWDLNAAGTAFEDAERLAADPVTAALATAGRGQTARRQGHYEVAEALLSRALKELRRAGDDPGVATCLQELGRVVSLRGRRADATAFLEEAITLWRRLGNRRGVLDATVSLAKGAEAAGDLAGAEARLREALEECRHLDDDQQLAAALGNLADAVFVREGGIGRYVEAEALQRESLAIAERIGDRRREAVARNALGMICYRRNDPAGARLHWRATLDISEAIGDVRTTLGTLGALANVEAMDGNVDLGWQLVSECLRRQRELGEPRAVAHVLVAAIEIARDAERWDDARTMANEVGALAAALGDDRLRTTAAYHLACVAAAGDASCDALAHLIEVARTAFAAGDRHLAARAIEAAAVTLATHTDDLETAMFLLAAGEMFRGVERGRANVRPAIQVRHDAAITRGRAALGPAFERVWCDGRSSSPGDALARAADAVRRATPAREPAPTSPTSGQWRYEHGLWHVTFGAETAVVPDAKGMHHLARLLAAPHTALAATHLAGAGIDQPGLPTADAAAVRAYRRRLRQLDAEPSHERRVLEQQLASARRSDGDLRVERGTSERARKAVTKAIREAITRLEAAAPRSALHLRRTITTGTCCSYDPETEIDWHL